MAEDGPNDDIRARVARLAPVFRHVTRFEYLSGGYSNRNYRFTDDGRAFVVRLVDGPSVSRAAERRFLEQPIAPRVVAFDKATGDMITEWIDGVLLAERPLPPDDGARYLRHLHAVTPRGIRAYDVREVIEGYDSASPWLGILADLDWRPDTLVGCHNDLNPWNVIQTGDTWRTLDWEFAGDNDPLFDLLGFCHGAEYGEAELLRCLAAYFGDEAPNSSRITQTRFVYQLREHTWAVAMLKRGFGRAEIAAQARTTDQELRRLTRLMAS